MIPRDPPRTIPSPQRGFTLVEMIIVIVITGIIAAVVAIFIKSPIEGYVASARRADMTDIADTSVRRIGRDLRTALPNSVRVTTSGSVWYLEYLETIAGGRYNTATTTADCLNTGGCTMLATTGDLVSGAAGATSSALVNGGTITAGTSRLVVYNYYNNAGADCGASTPSAYCAAGSGGAPTITSIKNGATDATADEINFSAFTFLPSGGSPNNRFQIVSQPVSYVCDPTAGTLTRYWGYAIQPAQPSDATAAPLSSASSALLASNVSACGFKYDASVVAQRSGLVTVRLTITESGESVALYSATHVSNIP